MVTTSAHSASQSTSDTEHGRQSATLSRLRTLERLYEQGYQNPLVDMTVRKLLERQVQEDGERLADLNVELARFEAQFGMNSAEFFATYQAGEMGDSADVFEWQALYQMADRLTEEIDTLIGELAED